MQAQKPVIAFQNYTQKDGLPSDIIIKFAQDKQGYIWINTFAGCSRYDGNGFTVFSHKDNDPFSFPFDRSKIISDREGAIWAYSSKGVSRFNFLKNRFEPLSYLLGDSSWKLSVQCMDFDNRNDIYLEADNKIYKVDLKKQQEQELGTVPNWAYNELFIDSKFRIWLVSNEGLCLFDAGKGTYTIYQDKQSKGDGVNHFFRIYEDTDGSLWLCSWGDGLKQFHTENGLFDTYHFSNKTSSSMAHNYATHIMKPYGAEHKNELWVSTMDDDLGIAIFDKRTKTFSYINHEENNPQSLIDNISLDIFQDKSGIIWYASQFGVGKYDPLAYRFPEVNLNHTPGFAQKENITQIIIDGSIAYLGSADNGLYVYDLKNRKVTDKVLFTSCCPRKEPEHSFIQALYKDDRGNIIAGSYLGAFHYNPLTKKATMIPGLHDLEVNAIAHDNAHHYFFATSKGLYIADPDLKATHLAHEDLVMSVESVFKDAKGKIWFGADGLCYFENGQYTRIKGKQTELFQKLNSSGIQSISGYEQDKLLLGTDIGLFIYDERSGQLRLFDKASGLAHASVGKTIADREGNIWALQEIGLSRINPKTGRITNYGNEEGLSGPTFTNGALTMDDSGRIWFGCYISLYAFYPDQLLSNNSRAKVYITEARIGDSVLGINAVAFSDSVLSLGPGQNSLSFTFAFLNYSNSRKNTYEYQLNASDNNWMTLENTANLSLSHLAPGTYTLRLRGKNSDGYFSENIATFRFEILPPVWLRWWFLALVGLVAFAIAFWLVRLRIKNIRRSAETRQRMAEAETKALRAQMNPHFIFNCMNTIDSFVLQKKEIEASQLIQRFSKLTRRVLDHTSLSEITIGEEMETLRIYLQIEQTRHKNFIYTIATDSTFTEACLMPPLLLQPFVENAVLHGVRNKPGTEGLINISARMEDHKIHFTIEDNGVGRQMAAAQKQGQQSTHVSRGMEVTLSRLAALHPGKKEEDYIQFTDFSGSKTGTRVEIYIPVKHPGSC